MEYEHPNELSAYTNVTICQEENPGKSDGVNSSTSVVKIKFFKILCNLIFVWFIAEEYTSFTLHYVVRSKQNKLRLSKETLSHSDPGQVASWVKTIRNVVKGTCTGIKLITRMLVTEVFVQGGISNTQK